MSPSILDKIRGMFGSGSEFKNPRNIIITGVPRSGTTLTCFLLTEIPNAVGLNEPVKIGRLGGKEDILEGVEQFFNRNRHTLIHEGFALARATEEGITDNNFSKDPADRKTLVRKQKVKIDKELQDDFYLCVKHNATFTTLMEDLRKKYPFYAQVRNPIPVLGSWNSLDLPASRGEVRIADKLNPKLYNELLAIPDVYDKQLHILNWYYESYTRLPAENIIRYEELVKTNGKALKIIVPAAADLEYPLESKNKSKLYDSDIMKRLGEKLLSNTNHACWEFYTPEQVEGMLL
ncbi:MAG: hypothetical protein KDC34_05585 [Saprospiraceae bacterium]|nr:hypothetical protein [Saprospiraceae bacterium]